MRSWAPERKEVDVEGVEVYSLGQARNVVRSWAPERKEVDVEGVEVYSLGQEREEVAR